jgi:hypothetical protein
MPGWLSFDALIVSFTFLYVFAIGWRLAGPVCALVAAILLFVLAPRGDFLFFAGGVYHFLAWRSSGPDARGHVIAMALFFAFGFVTNGVFAISLPIVLTAAALLKHEDRVHRQFESQPADDMFRVPLTGWLTLSYFTDVWADVQARHLSVIVVFGALSVLWRTLRHRWVEGALLALWFAVPMAWLSVATAPHVHDAYPFLPPIALTGAYGVAAIAGWIWRLVQRTGDRPPVSTGSR